MRNLIQAGPVQRSALAAHEQLDGGARPDAPTGLIRESWQRSASFKADRAAGFRLGRAGGLPHAAPPGRDYAGHQQAPGPAQPRKRALGGSRGLGAGGWSRNGNVAYRAGRDIQAGRVWVNNYHAYPAGAAFGGYKSSGT